MRENKHIDIQIFDDTVTFTATDNDESIMLSKDAFFELKHLIEHIHYLPQANTFVLNRRMIGELSLLALTGREITEIISALRHELDNCANVRVDGGVAIRQLLHKLDPEVFAKEEDEHA